MSDTAVRTAASRDRRIAVGCLLLLVVLWGGNYTWVKIALRDVGPFYLNLFRYAGAVIVLGVVAAAAGRLRTLAPERGERLQLGIIGFLQATVTTTATTVAMVWLDASQVVLIAYSVPVWALLWGALVLRERIAALAAIGAALGLSGVIVLGDPFAAEWQPGQVPGILAALIGVNGWALGAVLYRRRAWKTGFWRQVFWQLLVTALAMAVLAPLIEDPSRIRFSAPMLGVVAYNVVGPTVLGFFLWSHALSRVPAATAGQVMILAPIFGVLQSHVVLGESIGTNLLLASLLVVSGAVLALRAT